MLYGLGVDCPEQVGRRHICDEDLEQDVHSLPERRKDELLLLLVLSLLVPHNIVKDLTVLCVVRFPFVENFVYGRTTGAGYHLGVVPNTTCGVPG